MTKNQLKQLIKYTVKEWISRSPHVISMGSRSALSGPEEWEAIRESSNNSNFIEHKDWTVHKSVPTKKVFVHINETREDLQFEVNITGVLKNDGLNKERLEKHINKAAKAWTNEAKNLYNNPELNEIGNSIELSWKECFKQALQSENVKQYIKKQEPIIDPVNFSYSL